MTEMLSALSLKKALRAVMFFLVSILMTGCYGLKTVPVNKIPAERKILVIHAEDNFWRTDSYSISDGILTAHIAADSIKVDRGNSAHVYAAPISAVNIEGATLTVPVLNIAKADYHEFNMGETAGFGAVWVLIVLTVLMFLG